MKPEYRYVGKNTERREARDIVTGRAIFLDDYNLPRQLYTKMLKSPHPHANIVSIDISEAEKLEGVKAVLCLDNLPEECKSWSLGFPYHKPIFDRRLRYVGDPVATVAAETVEIAEEALKLIKVEYELLQPIYTPLESSQPEAIQLYDHIPGNKVPYGIGLPGFPLGEHGVEFKHIDKGDPEKAFAECDAVVEGTATYSASHAPLAPETPAVLAKWTGPGNLHIRASSQSPNLLRIQLSSKMPDVVVRSESFNVGGSYGNKNHITCMIMHASALALVTNRPVKFVYTKSEQLLAYETRLGSNMTLKVGIKDGLVHAMQGRWLIDTGSCNDIGQAQMGVGLGEMQLVCSKCKNWDFSADIYYTNKEPAGVVRGFGGQELKAAMMPIIAQCTAKLNLDPVEFYKNNFVREGDPYTWRDGTNWVCKYADYRPAMTQAAEKFNWAEKFKGWYKPTSVNGSKVTGVGVSLHGNCDVGEDCSEAYVRLEPYGYAVVHCTVAEAGQGQRNQAIKIAAEILNMPFEKVRITDPDNLVNPHEFGLVGSRGTIAVSTAVGEAAMKAKEKLLQKGADFFHCPIEAVDTEDGFIYLKENPEVRAPWFPVIEFGHTITGEGKYQEQFAIPNFCMLFTEVEVDTETGETKLINVTGGTDVGQMLDPATLELQFQGCIGSAALDTGLIDGHVLDTHHGRIVTSNMIDYKWRLFNEFPEFHSVILESQYDISPFKAIGFGEISGAPGPSAIAMAISNAIGQDFIEYPATPAAILKALGKA